jgi:U3 small nucleolar RNA-associated protein 20
LLTEKTTNVLWNLIFYGFFGHTLASQILLLFAQLDALPLTIPSLHGTLLRYITALFVAADMSMWLGPGLKFLQRTWRWNSVAAMTTTTTTEHDEPMSVQESAGLVVTFALKFNGCLASSNWGGWKPVALPLLYRSVVKPEVDSKVLLDFLARLKRLGKVGGGGGGSGEKKEKEVAEGMWKKVEGYAVGRLTVLKEKCGQEMDDSLVSNLDFFIGSFSN